MDQHEKASEQIARVEDAPLRCSIFDEVLPPENPRVRYIVAAIALVIAAVSFFIIAPWAGSPETYRDIIASIDQRRDTVMQLVAGSTGTSAAITLLPGDVGTPIAEKLLDLGADFAIVIGALYLEKYLLTILGLAAFRFLIPIGCVLFAVSMVINGREALRGMALRLAARLVFFGIAISLVIPASVSVSNVIEETYESTMADTLAMMEETPEVETEQVEEEPKEGVDAIVDFFTSIPENITNTATGVSEDVQARLNLFIETLAVMIVTSCVIPILVLMFFLWLAKIILGVHIDVPASAMMPRSIKRHIK